MKTRLALFGLVALATSLAACGGGGGGSISAPPSTATPTPATTPTPTPIAGQYYGIPLSSKATFTLSGQSTVSTVYNYPNSPNTAYATPYPSTSAKTAITQVATLGTNAMPFKFTGGFTNIHVVETDAQTVRSSTLTSDEFFSQSPTAFFEIGSQQNDGAGTTYAYDYSSAPYQLDALPEASGASWSNPATLTFTENDADGTQNARTYAGNGTYTETSQLAAIASSATITEAADGSGTYTGPFGAGTYSIIKFSAPSNGTITVKICATCTTLSAHTYTPPDWISGPLANHGLYKETDAISAAPSFPTVCAVPSAFSQSGNRIVQTINRLDAILGYTEQETITTYTAKNVGPVCVQLNDVQTAYYDYNDDYTDGTNYHYHFVGTPLSVTTIAETLTLASANLQGNARRTASLHSNLSSPQVLIARSAFERLVENQRRDRARAFFRAMNAIVKGGQFQ